MSEKINYKEVMIRMKMDVDYIAEEAYQRGLEEGKKAFDLLESERNSEYQRGLNEGNDIGYKDGVNDGRNEAWEAARKIVLSPDEGGTSLPDLFAMFGNGSMQSVFRKYSASEAIEKMKAYEEKQKANEEINVGDEVMVYGNRGVVTYICGDVYTVMMYDGSCGKWVSADLRKTGKQHDIDKILEEMKE